MTDRHSSGPPALVVLLAALVSACGDGSAEVPSGTRYEVRGVIRDLQGIDGERFRLTIEHEAIDDLVGIDGEIEGMESMTMALSVWPGASLPDDLRRGSKVRFVLDVDWERSPTALIVDLEALPEGVELDLHSDGVP